ncbi:hypothetical protein PUNSTDRAFT_140657 [Punctularia strigosozonata HHB-11173 SS5]|uniref:uncharacterized protein n=1 Tax=Punctularia strigosozonata (strain HHB-11173) TaxID=741275 RepID=UPI00044162BC|nr:uncharacterized protein PUNSTDRAFT_140657 [Punctularia strigosozonata HHB-11173 SS5]EIN14346.1 hypothetical protein PUNSTDRAFT_140657 [Punctularia strigosozonata HHB-11173 SS5]
MLPSRTIGKARRRSSTSVSKAHNKRPKLEDQENEEEDEDMTSILLQIEQHEASEALARRLQNEMLRTQSQSSSALRPGDSPDVIVIEDDDDATIAKRLASEWAREDSDQDSGEFPPPRRDAELPRRTSDGTVSDRGIYTQNAFEVPPDQQLMPYRDLFVSPKICPGCRCKMESPRGHVMFSANVPPPTVVRLLHVTCSQCHANPGCTVEKCCAEVRAIALFEALGGFDRQYIGERIVSNTRARAQTATRKQPNAGSVGPGGTGYGVGTTGYDHHSYPSGGRAWKADVEIGIDHHAALAAHWEDAIVRALKTVTTYLPAPYSEDAQAYDMLPHPSIQPLLALSQLTDLLGDLLRNDSVTDWTGARGETYAAVLGLLKRMADCEFTIPTLVQERWARTDRNVGIEEWMWGETEIAWERDERGGCTEPNGEPGDFARNPPLYDCFKKLTKQCEAFLGGVAQLMENSQDDIEATIQAASLCGDMIAARDDIDRAMEVLGRTTLRSRCSKGKSKAGDPKADMEATYAQACERLAFRHVTLSVAGANGLSYPTFHYTREVQSTANATRLPKDRLRLVKELSTMSTSLPTGVWVRVDETRNDVIKIMIAGPDGTPYAGGLFEFDCFIPLEYPNTPPLMYLRTTAGGRVRFNPNLYADGKVCLSLLGTWHGRPEEQWSSKSTLLQVLVSIQSMIFVDLPYFNEPGHGKAKPKDPRSIVYNKHIALQTVRWAMVEWLHDDHKAGLWGDVIASHFGIRRQPIRECVAKWAPADPRVRAYRISSTATAGGWYEDGVGAGASSAIHGASEQGTMDLLAEYDKRIAKVMQWSFVNQVGA